MPLSVRQKKEILRSKDKAVSEANTLLKGKEKIVKKCECKKKNGHRISNQIYMFSGGFGEESLLFMAIGRLFDLVLKKLFKVFLRTLDKTHRH